MRKRISVWSDFMVVTDPQRARPDATPIDVQREHAALFMMFDESGLGEAEREAAEYASLSTSNAFPVKPWWQTQEVLEQGVRAAINGYIFGNLPGWKWTRASACAGIFLASARKGIFTPRIGMACV